MNSVLKTMTVLFFLLVGIAPAQEEKKKFVDFTKAYQEGMQLQWIDLEDLRFNQNKFVSEDGNYVAQDFDEFQTYNDLGLRYQFIEQEDFRRQMRLPKGEGIMIKAAPAKSKGYQLGFRKGDIVLRVANQPVDDQYKFVTAVKDNRGKAAIVNFRRAGTDDRLTFTLPAVKKEAAESWILGVQVDPISKTLKKHLRTEGIIIRSVVDKSPAKKMGLQADDVIVAIDSAKIGSLSDLQQHLKKSKGAKIKVHLIREGNNVSVEMIPMKQKKKANVEMGVPYLSWQFKQPANDYTFYSRYDFDRDGLNDFIMFPSPDSETGNQSLLKRLDELSKKIDQLTKQVNQLKSKK